VPNIALSDFIAQKTMGRWIMGAFCVTTGFELMNAAEFEKI
jgi:cobalamin-dependent methionine synthase I